MRQANAYYYIITVFHITRKALAFARSPHLSGRAGLSHGKANAHYR